MVRQLRGYGGGAAGGVVNIITKKGGGEWHGSWDAYFNAPEHKEEGATKRTNFSLTGPLGDEFSFRLYGNLDKTQADVGYQPGPSGPRVPERMPRRYQPGAKG